MFDQVCRLFLSPLTTYKTSTKQKYQNIFTSFLFMGAEIPINSCVIKGDKLRKYYNVMCDFCVLFHHKKDFL